MRELEFLPAWYPTLRRRRRIVLLQIWLTGAVVAALALWMLLAQRNVNAAQATLTSLNGQLRQTDRDLQRLAELQSLQRQMSQQAQVLALLGPHVPMARLIDVLQGIMPKEMALMDLSMETQTQTKPVSSLAAAGGAEPVTLRRMHVRLHGVAPSDVDLGDFLARLASIPYLSDVAMSYSRDRTDSGHVMREFEVAFNIDLDESN